MGLFVGRSGGSGSRLPRLGGQSVDGGLPESLGRIYLALLKGQNGIECLSTLALIGSGVGVIRALKFGSSFLGSFGD